MIFCSFPYFRFVKEKYLNNCLAILLFTLILFKVSSFHVYAHQDSASDEIENCSVCDLAIENQNTDYLLFTPQTLSITLIETNIEVLVKEYDAAVTSALFCHDLFGRPPPFTV